ncbi:MAG: dephospho-CoA kinase [Nevskiales bacterium]
MAYTVGLTGGIASGKSAVARCFVDLGIEVTDADQVAREVVVPGSAGLAQLVTRFGPSILTADGELDRASMRERVFGNSAERVALEQILHPLIRARLLELRDGVQSIYGILMVPLLVKLNLRSAINRLLVVDVEPEFQVSRLIERDRISPALAEQMLAAQESRESRLAAADDVLVNQGKVSELPALVERLHDGYRRLARGDIASWPRHRLP